MSTATANQIDHKTAFEEQGYIVLRNLIPEARLAALRQAIDARTAVIRAELAAEGLCTAGPAEPFARNLCFAGPNATRHGRGWTEALAGQAVYDLHHTPALLDALEPLLGPRICGQRQFNLRPKLPGQELTVVPWHQDTGYYGAHTAQDTIITVWMPLVPVDANNGCMQVVPGSHRQGAIDHRSGVGEGSFLEAAGNWDQHAMTLPMLPGDVLIMHNLVLHRSGENHSDGIRWSIDCRFFAPDTPSAADLLWKFPRPWLLRGGPLTPCEEWASWYR
jgi:phytanoyl-CoA hydroxylase